MNMIHQFSRTYADNVCSTSRTGCTNFKVSPKRTEPVRYSPAFIVAANLKLATPPTSFAADSMALLTALSLVDDLHVIDWPRGNEINFSGSRKMYEQVAWEIFYRGKHIVVSFITEDSSVDNTEYLIVSHVVGEGYHSQYRCIKVWMRWFNDQFNYTMVTPLISKQK